jgi:hypothetical protein
MGKVVFALSLSAALASGPADALTHGQLVALFPKHSGVSPPPPSGTCNLLQLSLFKILLLQTGAIQILGCTAATNYVTQLSGSKILLLQGGALQKS